MAENFKWPLLIYRSLWMCFNNGIRVFLRTQSSFKMFTDIQQTYSSFPLSSAFFIEKVKGGGLGESSNWQMTKICSDRAINLFWLIRCAERAVYVCVCSGQTRKNRNPIGHVLFIFRAWNTLTILNVSCSKLGGQWVELSTGYRLHDLSSCVIKDGSIITDMGKLTSHPRMKYVRMKKFYCWLDILRKLKRHVRCAGVQ